MPVATAAAHSGLRRPTSSPAVQPAKPPPDPIKGRDAYAPDELLVAALVDQSAADCGWLAWHTHLDAVVVRREPRSPLDPDSIGEFPEPPSTPLVIQRGQGEGPWSLWCRGRGIMACIVVPVRTRNHKIVGTMGLASGVAGSLNQDDVQRLQLIAPLAVHARRYEARLADMRQLFDEVSRTLENALALDKALRLPPTYREIARSVGESLDVSYCLIAIHDSPDTLTIRAAGGRRPPRFNGTTALPLTKLRRCAEALRERRAVVLKFSSNASPAEPERLALFSATTRYGVILPFFAGPRTQGVLILGEERRSRFQPLSPERVAILELVSSRIAHIMRMSRRLEYERTAERRRQRQLTAERQRLARDVHDEIGQALTALLVHVRFAISQGHAEPEELKILEQAARRALDGARALAYGFRQLDRGIGPLEEARSFAETVLRGARCRLSWVEERDDAKVAAKTLRELCRVIKEAISNIARHAHADMVKIRIEYPDGLIRVTIRDNGVGFSVRDARPAEDGRGLGLVGSAERLARVGGGFDVRSAPKRGTVVVIEAPRRLTS